MLPPTEAKIILCINNFFFVSLQTGLNAAPELIGIGDVGFFERELPIIVRKLVREFFCAAGVDVLNGGDFRS